MNKSKKKSEIYASFGANKDRVNISMKEDPYELARVIFCYLKDNLQADSDNLPETIDLLVALNASVSGMLSLLSEELIGVISEMTFMVSYKILSDAGIKIED